jgi:hypothetical protein
MTPYPGATGSYYVWVELSTRTDTGCVPGIFIQSLSGEGGIGFDIYADLRYNGRWLMTEVNGPRASARRLR